MEYFHVPVFFDEAITLLQIVPDACYIDCTLGGGGHFQAMIAKMKCNTLIGFDVDSDAIVNIRMKLENENFKQVDKFDDGWQFQKDNNQIFIIQQNFQNILSVTNLLSNKKNIPPIKGIILDLGVSSNQLDVAEKGFSYMKDGPLDMRMDKNLKVKASDLVNGLYEKELKKILQEFGEEQFAGQIAKAVITARLQKTIVTTGELTKLIRRATPSFYKNPYAKTFQALRIAVNDELGVLRKVCSSINQIIDHKGRVVTIAFHSLEDKIIKSYFSENPSYKMIQDVLQPTTASIDENKRSRSAKLRSYEKI